MIHIRDDISPADLLPKIKRLWDLSAEKIRRLDARRRPGEASPVFTVQGRYRAQGWTEWTQGFEFGSAILQGDATADHAFIDLGRQRTLDLMAPHVSHTGVHDHGFNNVSTYGALWRLMKEGRIPHNDWEQRFYEMALKCSAACQASRWAPTSDGGGYIYSFNGPQSLFVDTIRSCRSLAMGHLLGHRMMGERDREISLLGRLIDHARATAAFNIWYGPDDENGPRDFYDVRGRTSHESLFNTNTGDFRCPSTQQGYSPHSTWTRGLAWAVAGYPEQLEFFATLPDSDLEPHGGRANVEAFMLKAARATADFFIDNTPTCGVPYWDAGAPGLVHLGDYLNKPADPFNDHEPVDSSAAAIAAQGLLRLGSILESRNQPGDARRYAQAGLTCLNTLLDEPYLSTDPDHEGLTLHAVYHRPNGWDHVPQGRKVPCGESCMWGDYHTRELAYHAQRIAENAPYYRFFGP